MRWEIGWDEPRPKRTVPACPICGSEIEILYRDAKLGTILGCDVCVEAIDVDELEDEVDNF